MAGLTSLVTGLLWTPACAADTLPAFTMATPAAPNPPIALSLAQVLEAVQGNPDVLVALRNLDAAQADVLSAKRMPAPIFSTGVSSIDLHNGVGGGSLVTQKRLDKSLGVDWTWERGNKRALRTEQAERLVLAAQADSHETLVLQKIGALAAFYDLQAAQQRLQTLQNLAQSAEKLAQTAERRLKAGDLSAQDTARTQIEAARTQADLKTAQLDRQQAAQWLSTWTGLTVPAAGWQIQSDWPANATGSLPAADQIDALVELRSDVMAARTRLAAAQTAVESAQALRITDPTLGSTFDHIPNALGNTTRLLAFRIAMPLTTGHRFDGEIGRATAQEAQSRDVLKKTQIKARAELTALVQAWQASQSRLKIYEDSILPQAIRVATQAETAYNKGGLTLTDLLDARRTLQITQLDALAVRSEHAKAQGAWLLRQSAQVAP